MDMRLSATESVLRFVIVGRPEAILRASPRAVVESRDVIERRRPGVFARAVPVLVDEFGLECVKEALRDRIAEAASRPAGAHDDSEALGQLPDPEREKVPAPVGVEGEPWPWLTLG